MIPEGKYQARATGEFEIGRAETGTDQIGVSFQFTQGEHAGTILTWYGYLNDEDNIKRTMKSLRACGWLGDDITTLDGISNNEVNVTVEINEYNGNTTNRIAWVNGAGVAMKNVMNEGDKKAFAARMKGFAIASRGNAPSTRAMPPRSTQQRPATDYGPPSRGADEDIPF